VNELQNLPESGTLCSVRVEAGSTLLLQTGIAKPHNSVAVFEAERFFIPITLNGADGIVFRAIVAGEKTMRICVFLLKKKKKKKKKKTLSEMSWSQRLTCRLTSWLGLSKRLRLYENLQ
jgi:hypothetical protein